MLFHQVVKIKGAKAIGNKPDLSQLEAIDNLLAKC